MQGCFYDVKQNGEHGNPSSNRNEGITEILYVVSRQRKKKEKERKIDSLSKSEPENWGPAERDQ